MAYAFDGCLYNRNDKVTLMKCDLHIHTNYSDGKYPPSKVVKFALDAGVTHIAITDHDTVCGVREATEYGSQYGVEVIPGIEFSAIFEGRDVHILGYFIDYTSERVKNYLAKLKNQRESRAKKIVDKLNEMGYGINFARVKEIAQHGAIGRPHIAAALYEKGYIATKEEAFYGLIGNDDPAYIPKYEVSVPNAIRFLKENGAVVVLAHPGLIGDRDMVLRILEFDFDGIEVYHPRHSQSDTEFYKELADKKDLIITGGSDFHWFTQDVKIGIIEYECKSTIEKLYKRRRDNVK